MQIYILNDKPMYRVHFFNYKVVNSLLKLTYVSELLYSQVLNDHLSKTNCYYLTLILTPSLWLLNSGAYMDSIVVIPAEKSPL